MKNWLYSFLAVGVLASCGSDSEKNTAMNKKHQEKITYPTTQTKIVSDTLFGQVVKDPYRWLEDDYAQDTKDWVVAQNKVTQKYLSQIPYRDSLKNELTQLWNYEKVGVPFKKGDYTYFYKNDGLQNQSVLYRKDKDGKEEEFLNPNTFSKEGTTSLGSVSFTEDGSLMAYSISEGGSDWRKIIVLNTKTKEVIGETLEDVKFSGISWKGNEGFYYSSYKKPEGSVLSAKTDHHFLFYHQLNTPQSEDKVIFGDGKGEKFRYVGGGLSKDEKLLYVSVQNSTSGNRLFIKEVGKDADFKEITSDIKHDSYIFHKEGNDIYLVTNYNAPNKRLVKASLSNPSVSNWKDVIPETENVLSLSKGGNTIFAQYMKDAISVVKQYDFNGDLIREVNLPGVGTASGFGGKEEDEVVYFSFTNYKTPSSSYEFNVKSGESKLYWSPKIDFNADDYESKQVFYTSKDGTKIPMIITHKKGIKLDGTNPTILYGYGGFNVSLTPYFSTTNAVWLNHGGVYAVANLRGGGEYGKKWHLAGTKMQKQNVFDDFIAAGEFLINQKYTSKGKLAIRGGSNGGLLVGAVSTQRPDLMQVALPAVGVLDMLRYHKFTAGAGWAYDYGTADDNKEMFNYLLNYSPVHNVKKGVEYPATLVTTGDHDDRVVPAHSYKYIAELQAKHQGDNPVLIRVETDAGHGAGTPISKTIEQTADIFSFVLYNMDYQELP
jgi:prolyl oligopeptidase